MLGLLFKSWLIYTFLSFLFTSFNKHIIFRLNITTIAFFIVLLIYTYLYSLILLKSILYFFIRLNFYGLEIFFEILYLFNLLNFKSLKLFFSLIFFFLISIIILFIILFTKIYFLNISFRLLIKQFLVKSINFFIDFLSI